MVTGITFDGRKAIPAGLIDYAAVSQAPVRVELSEMRGSVDGKDHLQTLANDVPVSELQGTRKQQGV